MATPKPYTKTRYADLDLPILEARCDWITCTAQEREHCLALCAIADANGAAEVADGAQREEWRFQGYRGFKEGRWRWGAGKDGAICVVSGEQAQLASSWLADIAEHWSRVDLCVTVLDESGEMHPDVYYWERWPTAEHPHGRAPRLQRTQVYEGGATLNIGDRASSHFVRVYDKGAESPLEYPRGAWRWEIEMKREASEQQQKIFRNLQQPGVHVLNTISTEFSRRKLDVPFKTCSRVQRSTTIRYLHDADRTLGWLYQQVRPSVQFAAEARGREAVLAALDI